MRIIAGDPGRTSDPFGIVGLETRENDIHVKMARQYKGPFSQTAQAVVPILVKVKPHFFALETNNEGKRACKAFEDLGFEPLRIYTSAHLTKSADYLDVMDKSYMISWLRQNMNERLKFPSNPGTGILALKDQISRYGAFQSISGNITYKARAGHDDLVSALLIGCHVVEKYEASRASI